MLRLVSLSIEEYVNLFDIVIDSYESLNSIMKKFSIDIFNINENDYSNLIKHVSKPKLTKSFNNENNKDSPHTRKSAFAFLQFNDSNISDINKMILLHKQNYFQIIHDTVSPLYETHSNNSLDTKNISITSTSNKVIKNINIPFGILNFDDLKNQKHILKDIVESNTDIELASRKQITESYLEKNKFVNQRYTNYIKNRFILFYKT